MSPAPDAPPTHATLGPVANVAVIAEIGRRLADDGVYDPDPGGTRHFRLAAAPFHLNTEERAFFEVLGDHLLAFYGALNTLYRRALTNRAPGFVRDWLERGKPDDVLRLARMGRFKGDLPRVIRPDVFHTGDGWAITELDSVPGGIGLTDALNRAYADAGFAVAGGANGMTRGMARSLAEAAGIPDPVVAVVVSDESAAYREEMRHLARRLGERGTAAHVLHPSEVVFDEAGLSLVQNGGRHAIDVMYRFFELFDLPNIPKAELLLYAAKKGTVALTPPPKPQLEEKLAMALLHHPVLAPFWRAELGAERQRVLAGLFPPTWVLDPRPVPGHAVIPGLELGGRPAQEWAALKELGQKARRFVIKPSGFSERAWGSRGVAIGHDLPEDGWARAVDAALGAFDHTPHVLQPFRKARKDRVGFLDGETTRTLHGRTRLCPYYFVSGGRAELGGILATVCPPDKKRIHGMADAVMAPCGAA